MLDQTPLHTPKARRIATAFDTDDLQTIHDLIHKINACGSCEKSHYIDSYHGFDQYRCRACGCKVHERIESLPCPKELF